MENQREEQDMKITPDAFGHAHPQEGACVMEMVSLLSQSEFTDSPACSNDQITRIAIRVNDRLESKDRHLIMSQFDRLFGTAESEHSEGFRTRLKAYALSLLPDPEYPVAVRQHANLVRMVEDENALVWDATVWIRTWVAHPHSAEEKVKVLSDILDIHDEVMGRTEVPKQDLSKLMDLLAG